MGAPAVVLEMGGGDKDHGKEVERKVVQRLKTPDLPKRKIFEENPASKFRSASKNASPSVDGKDRIEGGNHTEQTSTSCAFS